MFPKRMPIHRQKGRFSVLYRELDLLCASIQDKKLRDSFKKCYLNTLETTVRYDKNGGVFVFTGDIPAMWLRDSSVQVSHYVPLANRDADVNDLVCQLLKRQFNSILVDSYANAFNKSANGKGHKDITKQNSLVWERKYEIDSLVYPLWLLNLYYDHTKNAAVFDSLFFTTFETVLNTLTIEQDHDEKSDYSFERPGTKDSLENGGKGASVGRTGMSWCAFRPSDDRCNYHYLVPANMFAVAVLRKLCANVTAAGLENPFALRCEKLCAEIDLGIRTHGIVETAEYGRLYAYEVDGKGAVLLMDDANVPSLLSMPYLGYCAKDDALYLNTRKFILSSANPYYYSGREASGVGSPHTPKGYIWHIGLIMEALTTDDAAVKEGVFNTLMKTTAGTGFMHEGFDCNNSKKYTRFWFAWANTLFAIFVLERLGKNVLRV